MEEPLPTYKDAVKKHMRTAQQYPATKVPNRRARISLYLGFFILCIIIVAVSVAITRINANNNNNNNNDNNHHHHDDANTFANGSTP